jgi:hypothetical protein
MGHLEKQAPLGLLLVLSILAANVCSVLAIMASTQPACCKCVATSAVRKAFAYDYIVPYSPKLTDTRSRV